MLPASDVASWEYSTDGGANWNTGSGTSFTLAEGAYAAGSVLVRQTDAHRRQPQQQHRRRRHITVDTFTPATPAISCTDTGASGSTASPTAGLTPSGVEAGATLEYSGRHELEQQRTDAAAEGSEYVHVRQTDVAGNTSAASAATPTRWIPRSRCPPLRWPMTRGTMARIA
ncbi:MAG: hypothetical protein KF778_13150 [Rhodocyclaceae bacterium]|nr:hypothetical protein [Rhodocyclaceae bacterium]